MRFGRTIASEILAALLVVVASHDATRVLAADPKLAAADPAAWAKQHIDELVALYREFHSHPELSNQEVKTAAQVAGEWKKAGFTVTTGVGGNGVVAILKNGPGPVLMLRTDLDALPVTE